MKRAQPLVRLLARGMLRRTHCAGGMVQRTDQGQRDGVMLSQQASKVKGKRLL